MWPKAARSATPPRSPIRPSWRRSRSAPSSRRPKTEGPDTSYLFDNWRWHREPVKGPAVVFDIDGVLSDAAGRQHYLERGRRDWDAFFDACGDDPLITEVGRLLELLDPSLAIVLLTGRPISVQPITVAWLERYELRWDLLIMRDYGDYEAAMYFKRRVVGELRAAGFDLRLAFEDDRRNVAMFHQQGVPCVYIHSGYFE